ncbi:DUF596 domain-containing protein [Roseateles sp.]|uniref:DUF596 domain-containing protein n=1 Tax=Roseateles sp. TaxID=1971397 RepID=UPI003BA44A9C
MKQERYEWIRDSSEGMELDAVWDYVMEDACTFEDRKALFLHVLERLLREGNIKLIHMDTDIPMRGTVKEQIQQFSDAFPKTMDEMDLGEGNGIGLWFLTEQCPGGSAWQVPPLTGDQLPE